MRSRTRASRGTLAARAERGIHWTRPRASSAVGRRALSTSSRRGRVRAARRTRTATRRATSTAASSTEGAARSNTPATPAHAHRPWARCEGATLECSTQHSLLLASYIDILSLQPPSSSVLPGSVSRRGLPPLSSLYCPLALLIPFSSCLFPLVCAISHHGPSLSDLFVRSVLIKKERIQCLPARSLDARTAIPCFPPLPQCEDYEMHVRNCTSAATTRSQTCQTKLKPSLGSRSCCPLISTPSSFSCAGFATWLCRSPAVSLRTLPSSGSGCVGICRVREFERSCVSA